jgi:hypothetical protein
VRVTNEFTIHCDLGKRRAKRQLLARLCFSLLLSFAQAKERRIEEMIYINKIPPNAMKSNFRQVSLLAIKSSYRLAAVLKINLL